MYLPVPLPVAVSRSFSRQRETNYARDRRLIGGKCRFGLASEVYSEFGAVVPSRFLDRSIYRNLRGEMRGRSLAHERREAKISEEGRTNYIRIPLLLSAVPASEYNGRKPPISLELHSLALSPTLHRQRRVTTPTGGSFSRFNLSPFCLPSPSPSFSPSRRRVPLILLFVLAIAISRVCRRSNICIIGDGISRPRDGVFVKSEHIVPTNHARRYEGNVTLSRFPAAPCRRPRERIFVEPYFYSYITRYRHSPLSPAACNFLRR